VGDCSAHFNLSPDTVLHHYIAVNMASGVAPLSYSWNWGDATPNDTVPYPDHTYASAGYYTICLTITDSAGCVNTYCNSFYLQLVPNPMIYVSVVPQTSTGIVEEQSAQAVLLFPNPVAELLTVILPEKKPNAAIKITNMLGQPEFSTIMNSQTLAIDVSALEKGVHVLTIAVGNRIVNRKILKQ
jgi:hypothetical protein